MHFAPLFKGSLEVESSHHRIGEVRLVTCEDILRVIFLILHEGHHLRVVLPLNPIVGIALVVQNQLGRLKLTLSAVDPPHCLKE